MSQLAFWLGSWRVSHVDEDGRSWAGTNAISLVEGGQAIEERFSMPQPDGDPMTGRSLSVPVAGRGWCQTWVDNAGNYLDFTGGWNGSELVLGRATVRDGADVLQRMVFYDIGPDSLTWEWQSSTDAGATWRLDWRLAYQRVDSPATQAHP
jgi:hypothetical protein